MPLDRPFVLCGWDPYGQPMTPKRYRDPETAAYVARLLRRSGFQVALIPAAPGGRRSEDGRRSPGRATTPDARNSRESGPCDPSRSATRVEPPAHDPSPLIHPLSGRIRPGDRNP